MPIPAPKQANIRLSGVARRYVDDQKRIARSVVERFSPTRFNLTAAAFRIDTSQPLSPRRWAKNAPHYAKLRITKAR
jgi:hypothetical protein